MANHHLVRKARLYWAQDRELPVDLHAKLSAEGFVIADLEALFRA